VTADPGAAIVRLGARGDGIAETAGGPCYVPFALPGERVRVSPTGLPELLSEPSPQRRQPLCRHFGTCGGCLAQHMGEELYAQWKRQILVEAFRQRGLEPPVAPLVTMAPGTRRRAVLAARWEQGALMLGYHRRRAREVFVLEECPVLAPAIVAELAVLRAIAAALAPRELKLAVLATPAGLDVAIEDGGGRLRAPMAAALASAAARQAIARMTHNEDIILERAKPELLMSGVAVVPPPGLFVQAVAAAEAAMAGEVREAVAGARRAGDLFAGLGTFTFAIARRVPVVAVDGQAKALAALQAAARRASGLKPIETRLRDLFREPLSGRELAAFDAIVLDPPRAGARAQAAEIGRSQVSCVVYVSCHAATLARDARLLVDAGFKLVRVVPIDQFLFTEHVEAVAVLRR
jgi:23S rRNA (uracil1939-C5)-methyltransferase